MLGINITSNSLLYELSSLLVDKGFKEIVPDSMETDYCAVSINLRRKLFAKTSYNKDFYNWTRSDVVALVLVPEWALESYINPNCLIDSDLKMPSIRERLMKSFKG